MPPTPEQADDDAGQQDVLTPELLVRAYLAGAFPMAEGRSGRVSWYCPDPRAIQPFVHDDPMGTFHIRRSLAKRVRQGRFEVTHDRAFAEVIAGCAAPRAEDDTWISPEIQSAFIALHHHGLAHSVEAWDGDQLVGGIYGLALGGAFFGESMYSRRPYASQVCLVHLVEHLRTRGYTLFDVQFVNPHIEQFGVVEVRHEQYMRLLTEAVALPVSWSDRAE